ncbi:LytR/AlgR family response regulator transcription factor [Anaerocolumna sp. MB42-C2]|uniref:LytR/AlgR family response regulator transcription factor n=1 Tax=Anaerocolumna sp. MB42-C2 TaxID=3070997 RepID=UPI0027DF6613|nr:LytTR family DNA-binding domain-containing protein [Anaerocolumna sp. MB42-C2]WMJ86536.1 LytTR family DNA-binding domain-containing protein [Anaerocolumna sp. MB42-C2]
MIRIAICDDNISLINSIENQISNIADENLSCDVFFSGVELIKYLESEQESFNIYLMDIEMPVQNGIETAAYIRKADRNALIIFITSHKEYVYEVFEVLPFRFLCKPVQFDSLKTVLQEAVEHIRNENQIFFFTVGHEKRQLPYKEITYFEGAGRKVRVHNTNDIVEYYGRISKVAPMLDINLFAQIHASYIVNMEYIRAIRQAEVELAGGVKLPISRKYQSALKYAHISFLKRRGGLL